MLSSNKRKRYFEEYIYEIDSSNEGRVSPVVKIAIVLIVIATLIYFLFF